MTPQSAKRVYRKFRVGCKCDFAAGGSSLPSAVVPEVDQGDETLGGSGSYVKTDAIVTMCFYTSSVGLQGCVDLNHHVWKVQKWCRCNELLQCMSAKARVFVCE